MVRFRGNGLNRNEKRYATATTAKVKDLKNLLNRNEKRYATATILSPLCKYLLIKYLHRFGLAKNNEFIPAKTKKLFKFYRHRKTSPQQKANATSPKLQLIASHPFKVSITRQTTKNQTNIYTKIPIDKNITH